MMVLAVDAGGTHCRLALATAKTCETVATGAANATSDLEGTIREILRGIDALSTKTALSLDQLTAVPAYLGVAGVINASVAATVRDRLPFKTAKIEGDQHNALRGALGDSDGYLAHCGTGSFFASKKNAQTVFAGGWGPVLDDVASAHWLGVCALRATLYAEDTLIPQTDLTQSLLSEFGGTSAIVNYAKNTSPAEIAVLAKQVTHFAAQGDTTAMQLMQQGAATVEEKLVQLGYKQGERICLTGGTAQHYRQYLSEHFKESLTDAAGEPLDGAIALAKEFALEQHS